MCGRFNQHSKLNRLLAQFAIEAGTEIQLPLRYNAAPTQDVAAVRQSDDRRELMLMRWGLIPSWSKDPKSGPLLINARAETAAEKPAFRAALKSRRCIIPAEGFYEWKKVGKTKQPYYFHRPDGEQIGFAGLWEQWNTIESCTILTTAANALVSPLHDRMPVILAPADYGEWLDPAVADVNKLLEPWHASEMLATAVNPFVNDARNEGPECIEPVAG